MKNSKRFLAIIVCMLTMVFTSFAFVACSTTDETYIVKFESDGGTVYKDFESDGSEFELPTPLKSGYTFIAWYDNKEFEGQGYTAVYTPTANVTLYAKYEAGEKYIVKFVSNGGTEYNDLEVVGQTVILPTPEKENAEFIGWYDNENCEGEKLGTEYTPTQSITLYAKFIDAPMVSFDVCGGVEIKAMPIGEITLPSPFKYGYSFKGWYDNKEFSGTALGDTYVANAAITLYAKWQKCTYLYLYYGQSADHFRYEYFKGDTINTAEFFTPDTMMIDEAEVPFVNWTYEDGSALPETITVGEEECIIVVANYDYSLVPAKHHLKENNDGSYTTTGNVAKVMQTSSMPYGIYSADLYFAKGRNSSINLALYMKDVKLDYSYEKEMSYVAVGINPGTGAINRCIVNNGWQSLTGGKVYPYSQKWLDKYNSSDMIEMNVEVRSYTDKFELYFDGELVFEFSNMTALDALEGTNFGIRCSNAGTEYSNFKFTPAEEAKAIQFYDGDEFIKEGYFGKGLTSSGKLSVPTVIKDNYAYETYYYDKELTSKVDLNSPQIEDGCVLYLGKEYSRLVASNMEFVDGVYVTPANTAALRSVLVQGTTTAKALSFSTTIKYKKGNGGAVGIAFGMNITGDYIWEGNGSTYMAVQLNPNNGGMQICYLSPAFNQFKNPSAPTLTGMPTNYQARFNAAAKGDIIEAKLEIRYFGTYFEVYVDDAHVYTNNTEIVSQINGLGYGFRSNSYSATLTPIEVKELNNKVTLINDGKTEYSYFADGEKLLLSTPVKESVVHANNNLTEYKFEGWFDENGVKYVSGDDPQEDLVLTAEYTEILTRNGAVITKDANGENVYTMTGTRATLQGFTFPDITLSQGTLSYDIKTIKPSKEFNVRIMFYADDDGKISFKGTGKQGSLWVNLNLASGVILIGQKVKGTSTNVYTVTYKEMKDCAYKQYYNSVAAGKELNLNLKVSFGKDSNGNFWMKYYVNDCLLFVYAYDEVAVKAVKNEEINYGNEKTNASAGNSAVFKDWANTHTNKQVGIVVWQAITGEFIISNVKVEEVTEALQIPGETAETSAQTAAYNSVCLIDDKSSGVKGNKNVTAQGKGV